MSILRNREWHVYFALFIVLFLVRLPSFFFSVFDWDESTLILMGQGILDGKLPYVDLWDIKPPASFYMYSLFIVLFGKSIAAVRLGGMLFIYVAAVFLYKTGKEMQWRTGGMISALLLIVFVSTGQSGLSTMTEHLLLVPISFMLYVFLTGVHKKSVFAVGLLLGLSILIKTTMLFESVAACIVLLSGLSEPDSQPQTRVKRCVTLAAGIAIPVAAFVLYYLANSRVDVFLRTNIVAALAYAGGRTTTSLSRSSVFLVNIKDNITTNLPLWLLCICGGVYLLFFEKETRRFLSIMVIFFMAQICSLFIIGQPAGYHYLITSVPLMGLVGGVALSHLASDGCPGRKCFRLIIIVVAGAVLIYLLQGTVGKYYGQVISRATHKQPLEDDACYRIARFLDRGGVRNQYIYMVNSCHIVYWITGSRCPTKYIHPSNLLVKEYMLKAIDGPDATKEKELLSILARQPLFIVRKTDSWIREEEGFKKILDNELIKDYEPVETIDGTYQIYKRRNDT